MAHKIYGVAQTINSANYVYFLAFEKLFALKQGLSRSLTYDLDATVTCEFTLILFHCSVHRCKHLQQSCYHFIVVKVLKSSGEIPFDVQAKKNI